MSAAETMTGYFVKCDHEGCGLRTGDFGDYAFWADADQAQVEWTDGEGVIDGDKAYCGEHVPAEVCRYGDDGKHWRKDPTSETCDECDRPYVERSTS